MFFWAGSIEGRGDSRCPFLSMLASTESKWDGIKNRFCGCIQYSLSRILERDPLSFFLPVIASPLSIFPFPPSSALRLFRPSIRICPILSPRFPHRRDWLIPFSMVVPAAGQLVVWGGMLSLFDRSTPASSFAPFHFAFIRCEIPNPRRPGTTAFWPACIINAVVCWTRRPTSIDPTSSIHGTSPYL